MRAQRIAQRRQIKKGMKRVITQLKGELGEASRLNHILSQIAEAQHTKIATLEADAEKAKGV